MAVSFGVSTRRPVTSWPNRVISSCDTHVPNGQGGGTSERRMRTSEWSTGVQATRARTDPATSTGRTRNFGMGCASDLGVALTRSTAERISVPSRPRYVATTSKYCSCPSVSPVRWQLFPVTGTGAGRPPSVVRITRTSCAAGSADQCRTRLRRAGVGFQVRNRRQ